MKDKCLMECCNQHWVWVKIKRFKGISYWICPICNIVHGLKPCKRLGFTGYGEREWMEELTKKLEKKVEDDEVGK